MPSLKRCLTYATIFAFVLMIVVSWKILNFEEFSTKSLLDVRQHIIRKYVNLTISGHQNLYKMLNTMDEEVHELLNLQTVESRKNLKLAFNLVVGIGSFLQIENFTWTPIFIFASDTIFNLICIIATSYLTQVVQECFDYLPKERKHKLPKKNIFLTFHKQLKEGREPEIKIVNDQGKSEAFKEILPQFRPQLIQPVQNTYPSLLPLFVYMILLFFTTCIHCWVASIEFLPALQDISEYVNGIDFNENMHVLLMIFCLLWKVIFVTTLWSTAEFFIQFCSWICRIKFTPLPLLIE